MCTPKICYLCVCVIINKRSFWTGLFGSGDSSVVRAPRTHDRKVLGSSTGRSSGRIFISRVNFLCWLLFRYPFHPRVTTVARKRSRLFRQKCRWQVTAKHTYSVLMWFWIKTGVWLTGVHRTCTETAAVSRGTRYKKDAVLIRNHMWHVRSESARENSAT